MLDPIHLTPASLSLGTLFSSSEILWYGSQEWTSRPRGDTSVSPVRDSSDVPGAGYFTVTAVVGRRCVFSVPTPKTPSETRYPDIGVDDSYDEDS